MLTSLYKEHQQTQQQLKQQQDQLHAKAVADTKEFVNCMVDTVNSRVAKAYMNQKRLDAETKRLQQNAQLFSRKSTQWLKLVDEFHSALKELGDVENWARSMERDMETVCNTLQLAYDQRTASQQLQPEQY